MTETGTAHAMKMFVLIPKKPGISRSSFHLHWRTTHADLARRIQTLERYSQSHEEAALTSEVIRPPFSVSPFSGVSEAWFASSHDALGMAESPEYRNGALLDEPHFMDVGRKVRLFTSAVSASAGEPERLEDAPLKLLLFSARGEGVGREELDAHWTRDHAELVRRLPRLAAYRQRPVSSWVSGTRQPDWAYAEELWWRSEAELVAAWSSATAAELHRRARPFVAQGSIGMAAADHRVIWPD